MAVVLNRTTKQLILSAHTPNFPVADWIINPNLSAVVGQPTKYFIITGDVVTLASVGEQATIDAALDATRVAAEKADAKSVVDLERVIRALVDLLPTEFNILRALHSLPDRTAAQVNSALKANIDAQP